MLLYAGYSVFTYIDLFHLHHIYTKSNFAHHHHAFCSLKMWPYSLQVKTSSGGTQFPYKNNPKFIQYTTITALIYHCHHHLQI
jgi:hypothetical protein